MRTFLKIFAVIFFIAGSTQVFANGESLYKQSCFACHDNAVAGAPKLGDKKLWAPRIATGIDAMVKTVITGKTAMPPRGGTQFTDEQIKQVVEYMVSKAQ